MSTWRQRAAQERRAARRARQLPREPANRAATSITIISTLGWLVTFALAIVVLPDQVPIHWSNGSGADGLSQPDNWTSKTGALVFMVLAFLSVGAMTLLSRLVLKAPYTISAPNKEWWMARAERLVRLERILREDLLRIVSVTLLLLAGVNIQITLAAQRTGGAAPGWTFWLLLGGYLLAIASILVRMMTGSRYRPDDDGLATPSAEATFAAARRYRQAPRW